MIIHITILFTLFSFPEQYYFSEYDFLKIGICYDFQMQKYDTIKMEENDVKVDMTVTDRAYY